VKKDEKKRRLTAICIYKDPNVQAKILKCLITYVVLIIDIQRIE